MSAHTSIQSDFRWSTCGCAQLFVGSISAALVIASIVVGLEVSVATARSGVEFSEDASRQIVNRTHKGDFQMIASTMRQDAASRSNEIGASQAQTLDLKLAIGCELLISPLAHPLLARVARRCLS